MFLFASHTEASVPNTTNTTHKRRHADTALLTDVAGLCERLNCCRDVAYQLIKADEVDSFTIGNARRVTIASINLYIARRLADTKKFKHVPAHTRRFKQKACTTGPP
jgi:hypothetical protein